jgi:Raf kinase inhibitor-like YbhB/YbcL family protein
MISAGVMMERIAVHLDFKEFPREHTCDGRNRSPRIRVEGAKGKTMALIMDDPDAPRGTWVHWVIWNMPVVGEIPAEFPKARTTEIPFHSVQGSNTGRGVGYDGPCPPPGKPHRYYFKIIVLDADLDLAPGATADELRKAIGGHIVQTGETMAMYGR